jgi:hypothetical protein
LLFAARTGRGFLAACFTREFSLRLPIFIEDLKIDPTESTPPSLCAATAANPIDAMHPHEEQSGFPPNWHGVIFVTKSADNVCVVSAKTHSCGLCGGDANCRITASGISNFGYRFRNTIISSITRPRSSRVSISGI